MLVLQQLQFTLVVLTSLIGLSSPHGLMTIPKARNKFAHERADGLGEPEYCPHCMNMPDIPNAFSTQPYFEIDTDDTIKRFSICGVAQDSLTHKYTEGEGFWEKSWIPHKSLHEFNYITKFAKGDELDIEFELTAHHMGYIEVSVCQEDPPTMKCFNEGRLNRSPVTTAWMTSLGGIPIPYNPVKPHQVYLPPRNCGEPTGHHGGQVVRVTMDLRAGLQANKMSVLRWRYVTGNSCVPPGFKEFFADIPSPPGCVWANLNMGPCGEGTAKEEFANCADVWIGSPQAHHNAYLDGSPVPDPEPEPEEDDDVFPDSDPVPHTTDSPTPTNPTDPGQPTSTYVPPAPSSGLQLASKHPCEVFTESMFNQITGGSNDPVYSYDGLCQAIALYNSLHNEKVFGMGTEQNQRAELAAFIGNTKHETASFMAPREYLMCGDHKIVNGETFCKPCDSWNFDWGTKKCLVSAVADGKTLSSGTHGMYCQSWNTPTSNPMGCPCGGVVGSDFSHPGYINAKKLFFGRGAIQLSWNYNYIHASIAMTGSSSTLCDNPELVATEGRYAWGTAIYYWMENKLGNPQRTSHQHALEGDYGGTVSNINGGLECPAGGGWFATAVIARIEHYCQASTILKTTTLLDFSGCSGLQQVFDSCVAGGGCPSCAVWQGSGNTPGDTPDDSGDSPPTSPPTSSPTILPSFPGSECVDDADAQISNKRGNRQTTCATILALFNQKIQSNLLDKATKKYKTFCIKMNAWPTFKENCCSSCATMYNVLHGGTDTPTPRPTSGPTTGPTAGPTVTTVVVDPTDPGPTFPSSPSVDCIGCAPTDCIKNPNAPNHITNARCNACALDGAWPCNLVFPPFDKTPACICSANPNPPQTCLAQFTDNCNDYLDMECCPGTECIGEQWQWSYSQCLVPARRMSEIPEFDGDPPYYTKGERGKNEQNGGRTIAIIVAVAFSVMTTLFAAFASYKVGVGKRMRRKSSEVAFVSLSETPAKDKNPDSPSHRKNLTPRTKEALKAFDGIDSSGS